MNSILQCLGYDGDGGYTDIHRHNEEFRTFFSESILPRPQETDSSPSRVIINKQTFTRQATIDCLRSIRERKLPQLDEM